jgi:hypothetical protein
MPVMIALVASAAGLLVGVAVTASRAAQIQGQLQAQASEIRRLADAAAGRELVAEQLRTGLEGARRALEHLQVRDQERRGTDAEHREVMHRLATVLAGGASTGRAGENVLRQHLAQLPPGMLVTDFRVGGKVVEFGLLLPDGRRLPIDSKWTARSELEELERAQGGPDRDRCARAVERAVTLRAREVAQYLDPAVTAPVAVAAVPDAAYAILRRAHADAYARGVVIVPYGSALPIVLFLYALVERFGAAADVQSALAEVGGVFDAMEAVVENKFVRAATMIANGSEAFRSQLGQARGSIARARRAGAASVPADTGHPGDAIPEETLSVVH